MKLQALRFSLGTVLAFVSAYGNAVEAQSSLSSENASTPPRITDTASQNPAARVLGNGVFTAGTTGQTVDAITRVALPSRRITFSLDAMLMGYTLDGQTFGAVPPNLTLSSVTLYDLTDLGTGGTLGAASLPTVSLYGNQGTKLMGTANRSTGTGEPVLVRLADGSEVSLTPVTYTFVEQDITLEGSTDYRLTLNAAGVTPILPLFTNAATKADSGFDLTDVPGYAPFLSFTGTVSVTDVAVRAEGKAASLATLLKPSFSDSADQIVTVTLAQGAQLTLDRSVKDATLIFEAEGAAAVAFVEAASLTCPFVFRNATGVDNGLITLSGPWEDVSTYDGKQIWQPKSLAIDCDVNVDSPLPLIASGWFQQKSVRVLPGRTLRLTHEAATAERLPDVLLTAPTANLAFAGEGKTGGLPAKYSDLFFGTSGTVTLERPVVFAPTGNENDSNGSVFRIGNQGDAGYNFTLNVDETFSSTPRLVLGGKSGSATLNLRGAEATTYAAVINFDTGSTLTQKAGALTLGNADWATKFVGDSATLVFGDGDTENGLATATLFGIPYGVTSGGVTTDYRGAADLTVKADATLLLNECDLPAVAGTPDYALYPVGKRSLKVQGGTVKANTGAAVTMVFENPEPQAAPMAVAEIPGLEVIGSANLESSDTTASSLTLDALKGNGSVAFSGRVNVDTVRVEEGKTLSLDLRKGTDGADDALGGSAVALDAVSGSAGTVRFGLLGDGGTSGEQAVIDSLLAGGFTGTVGFLMPDYPTVDFEATRLPALPFSLEVQPGQTIVMRLDQYADADILWPEDDAGVELILVEAGPFGGEASLPAWPQGVRMEFHRYDDSSDGHSALPGEDYDATRNDDGLTIDLTWKNPVLTGKVAWLDMEFNGDSKNTGWLRLSDDPDYDGMLTGWTDAPSQNAGELITSGLAYAETFNPSSEGIDIDYAPYIAVETIDAYPEAWSLVTRVTVPRYDNTVILTMGANCYAGDEDKTVLALTTGKIKSDYSNDNIGDEVILWYIPNNSTEGMKALATAKVPLATEMPHLVSILYDAGHIQVYFDGNQLIETTLPAGTVIGPGLQAGRLIGGTNVNESLRNAFEQADGSRDGTIDFLRVYRGILSVKALDTLVRDNPYIHRDPGTSTTRHRDVRYLRIVDENTDEPWVKEGAWERQYRVVGSSGGYTWLPNGKYAEPAEGSMVVIHCTSGNATLRVNTEKHDLFPSANRTYAMLVVTGKDIEDVINENWDNNWTGGTLTIAPYDNRNTPENEWYTERTKDGEFRYGTIRFSGGAGQTINRIHTALLTFFHDELPLAAYILTHTIIHGSVVDLASDGVQVRRGAMATFRADDLITRGFNGEYFVRQLTGPLSGSNIDGYHGIAWDDRIGFGNVQNNADITDFNQQTSKFAWVPTFENAESEWKLDDVTHDYGNVQTIDTGFGDKQLPQTGVFVRVAKVPGRLYLELNKDEIKAGGALSEQAWYRYGYHGDEPAGTVSHMEPEPMHEGDFEKAVALSIRLENGKTRTLRADSAANGLTVNELTIDKPKADDGTANETLQILPQDGTGYSLKVMEAVSTDRRLEVYSAQGSGSEASATGADGVKLHAVYDEATETNIGAKLYGIETGAFVAGNSSINHALDGSSIARIESVGTIRFTAAQDLSATTLAAAKGATLEQTGVATETATAEQVGAENAFRAKAMELAQGSRFRFASSAATVDEGITLTGAATLEGTGTAATLTPNAGLVAGEGVSAKAILDAKENASWKLLNREVGGLPLTKVGAGVADIATDLPPNAGFVDVQEGTLRVATGLAGEGQAVGQASLNVETGATLAPTSGTIAEDVLAEIPAGQTVSGLGRIDGTLRLETDATLDAREANESSLSVRDVQTDGLTALADVDVSLPDGASDGLVFLRSDETTLNWAARARLLATDSSATRWDVLLRYRPGQVPEGTDYLVGVAGLSVPNPDGLPEDIRPGDDDLVDNEWPDGSGDDPAVDDEVTDQIQGGGNVAGKAEGYTMANHKWLMAPDIANAYACFGNVWVLAPRTTDKQREDYATRDLLMAYEFGISRMAFVDDGTRIVVEAKLRNALKDCPYFTDEQRQGAGAFKPSYLPGVRLTIVGPSGPLTGVTEITDEARIRDYGFSPDMPTTEVARWFLVPYTEDNFPAGESAHLTVRAIPPSEPAAPTAAE